jgi:hypothetical protein
MVVPHITSEATLIVTMSWHDNNYVINAVMHLFLWLSQEDQKEVKEQQGSYLFVVSL